MIGFTKLFSSLVTSTIWREDDKTRIVWITMLAIADRDGQVAASIPGLAAISNVTIPECESAIEKLLAPDRYSRTQENDGRRVEAIDGGWRLLNYAKYRQLGRNEDRREYFREKKREQRGLSTMSTQSTNVHASPPIAEAEAEAEKRSPDSSEPPAAAEQVVWFFPVVGNGSARWPLTLSKHRSFVAAFPGVDVPAQYPRVAAWLEANPTKRKTARGMARFLFGWLERQQNQTRNGGPPIANGARPGEKPWEAAVREERERRSREAADADKRSAAALAGVGRR